MAFATHVPTQAETLAKEVRKLLPLTVNELETHDDPTWAVLDAGAHAAMIRIVRLGDGGQDKKVRDLFVEYLMNAVNSYDTMSNAEQIRCNQLQAQVDDLRMTLKTLSLLLNTRMDVNVSYKHSVDLIERALR